jgi:hypothetical protein
MPFVSGFLRVRRRRPGEPTQPLPPEDGGEDGGDDGDITHPIVPPELELPPGIWPPPTTGHPIQPLPPATGGKPEIPPGAIWPRPPGPVEGKFVVLCHIPDHGWHYVVIDPDAWPELPEKPEPKR